MRSEREAAMTTEQEKVLEALQTALLMENDGKECYLQAAVGSKNEAGRKLLQSLAEEEDIHRHKLETIYNAISADKSWPQSTSIPDGEQELDLHLPRHVKQWL